MQPHIGISVPEECFGRRGHPFVCTGVGFLIPGPISVLLPTLDSACILWREKTLLSVAALFALGSFSLSPLTLLRLSPLAARTDCTHYPRCCVVQFLSLLNITLLLIGKAWGEKKLTRL